MNFTYNDFLLFTGVGSSQVNESLYLTALRSALEYVKSVYLLYPEEDNIEYVRFLDSPAVSFRIPFNNFTINSITYDGNTLVDEVDYTYYGDDVELTTTLAEYRKPLIININVGYASGDTPDVLIEAIFRHAYAIIQQIENKTDVIKDVLNSEGNTTRYNIGIDNVPPASKSIYEYYSNRNRIFV